MTESNITKVYLLSVPLESDCKNTLYFTNKSNQQNYFASKVKSSATDFTYQRKDNVIWYPAHYDDIYDCNYVMFQNTKYNNKWFYAFIKDMKYENNGCTMIEIETDVIQTWMFDEKGNAGYIVKPSFVEREHVDNDKEGIHTVPEGLETGDYICNNKFEDSNGQRVLICAALSDYANKKLDVKGALYGGVYSGMAYQVFGTETQGIDALNNKLNSYDDDAKADAINSLFMVPRWIYDKLKPGSETLVIVEGSIPSHSEVVGYNIPITKQKTLNSYEPRNKKLLCYPYNYLYASNNAGGSAVYQYELFSDDNCQFEVKGAICPGCSIRMTPLNYKGESINNDEGLNGGKYPICCWNSDAFTNWMTQNAVNVGISVVSGVAQMAFGGAFGVVGGISTIANTMAQVHQASMMPDQVKGNTNCGDVITGSKQNCFMIYQMSIKKEWAERLDRYFDMFGYKVNMVKTPNKAHRGRWWYTQTKEVKIEGNIPCNDMQKIKDCYNNGIRFWRNAAEMNNYDLSNEIV